MRTDSTDAATFEELFTFASRRAWRTEAEVTTRAAAIDAACARPELRLLANGVTFRVVPGLMTPFRATRPDLVELSPRAVDHGAAGALAVHVRHALEIAMWHRLLPAARVPVDHIVAAVLSCWTALRYMDELPCSQRTRALEEDGEWFQHLAGLFDDGAARDRPIATGLASLCSRLLPLQGADTLGTCDESSVEEAAARLATELLPLAAPLETILGSGGDSRLKVDPATRLNKYGCSTTPRPVVTFSSCTASSPSDIGYWSAERARRSLIRSVAAGRTYLAACGEMIEQTREELRDLLGLAGMAGSEVVLAASGTDCELLALHAALTGHGAPLLTIVMGPDEIGSGSLPAASGLHFDSMAPLTLGVSAGMPVEGLPVDRVRVHPVRLRGRTGEPVPIAEIDREVAERARQEAQRGGRVLLHVVDSSKTGMRAPSLGLVEALQKELGDSLVVLIDAAQMRTRPEHLAASVSAGAMVMISGSKFFTGAPFSGALLVPPHLASRLRDAPEVPNGFCAYFSGVEAPPRWERFRAALPARPNLGLLMRWRTALAEMQGFRAVRADTRNEWYAAFRAEAAGLLGRAEHLERVEAPIGDRTPSWGPDWDAAPTIFTFFLREGDPQSGHWRLLDYDEAWEIYLALNRDISPVFTSESLADPDQVLARTPCHFGQPVRIKGPDGTFKGALRLAVGARFVSRIAFDPTLGPDPVARLHAQLRDLRQAIAKAELVVRFWRHVRARLDAGRAQAAPAGMAHPSRASAVGGDRDGRSVPV